MFSLDKSGSEAGLDDRSRHETTLDHPSAHETTLDHPSAYETTLNGKVVVTLNLWLEKMVTATVGHATSLCLIRRLSGFIGFCAELKVAGEMVVDVSKFLRYACGPSAGPDWERLLDRDQLVGFV